MALEDADVPVDIVAVPVTVELPDGEGVVPLRP